MAEISKYRICEALVSGDLEREVEALLTEGWRLLGNLLVTTEPEDGIHFIQAMVRDE